MAKDIPPPTQTRSLFKQNCLYAEFNVDPVTTNRLANILNENLEQGLCKRGR